MTFIDTDTEKSFKPFGLSEGDVLTVVYRGVTRYLNIEKKTEFKTLDELKAFAKERGAK